MRVLALVAVLFATAACPSPPRSPVRAPVARDDAADVVRAPAPSTPTDVISAGSVNGVVDADARASDLPGPRCRTDEDCRVRGRVGRCFNEALAAQYTQAFRDCAEGRAWRDAHRIGTCVYDECRDNPRTGDDDCGPGMRCATLEMVPFPQRVCTPANCESDRQCRRHVGGRCVPYLAAGHCVRGGWACSYPNDPCIPRDPHRLCRVRPGVLTFCAPRDGRFRCVDEPVMLPDAGTE